jgi:predicted lipoprotein with Yx(FWY)xxD motif
MNRRQYIETGIVTITTGILAGCSGGGGGGGDGGGGGTTGGGGGETSGGGTATPGGGGAATTGEQQQMTTTGGGGMTTGGTTTQFSATVNVLSDETWGDILVGPNGLSLYLLTSDSSGKSTCTSDRCTNIWPPLTNKNPIKSDAVTAKLDTFTRSNGSTQVQVAGHPLYYYQPDQQPGDTKGQEIESFGGEWYLLRPDGSEAEEKKAGGSTKMTSTMNATTTAGSSGSGSGSGY